MAICNTYKLNDNLDVLLNKASNLVNQTTPLTTTPIYKFERGLNRLKIKLIHIY